MINTLHNQMIDDSFQKYVNNNNEINTFLYRIFDNNIYDDRVIINGKINKIVNEPKKLNEYLNIDETCGNIVHIPMIHHIYIEYMSNNYVIDIDDISLSNKFFSYDNDEIKIFSVKNNNNITYQDIVIQTKTTIIIIQLYKFRQPLESITHGAFIIYQENEDDKFQNNTIYYTKDNMNLLLDDLKDNRKILVNKIRKNSICF
jgi:hypothetical protein